MYSKLKLSELKNTNFKTKHHFLYKIVKVLEVANFTFLANFRFLTLYLETFCLLSVSTSCSHKCLCPLSTGVYLCQTGLLCPPTGGWTYYFCFFRRPASHLVSRHFRQQFLSYLYQIWHAGLLGS